MHKKKRGFKKFRTTEYLKKKIEYKNMITNIIIPIICIYVHATNVFRFVQSIIRN